MYPNPSDNFVTINIGIEEVCTLQLIDAFGKIVHSSIFTGPASNIDISSLVAGFYFAEVINAGGEIMGRAKVIVQ
ncbi:MAG: T9SS type A sorting domain-containing protein [Chitinophagales bacterium]|nr:T9SS type A sorting domain-containing protein [Chitinophagales bacterium]